MWTNRICKRSSRNSSSGEPIDYGVLGSLGATDFHSHVLPGMDDGSPDAETSLAMLSEMKRQSTAAVVATPHFYADREYPDDFLIRRDEAAASLAPYLRDGSYPTVYVGAEVAYFPGIGETRDLEKLCIRGTRFVLVEMPFSRWTPFNLEDVVSIRRKLGLSPILAHVERFAPFYRRADLVFLTENHVLLQHNAEFFLERKGMHRAISSVNGPDIRLIGSDSHNLTDRKPNLGDALLRLREKVDEDTLWRMASMGRQILVGAESIQNFLKQKV